ncbi:MAG: glutathione S-transferase family protein [Myxococcota bacterium]|nr:glutathione S-transferase family protein [Myxococcota bacterium]
MSLSESPHILYGSHASYATAKSRSYLRKKGIPFVERLPASKRFREYVRPASENHRIPQLEAPDGTVVQDTTAIFDYLEERFPEPPGYPPGPRQQLVARLLEVLLDAELGRAAWHYRWNYMDENYAFVGREFGRSFRPQGTDEELDHYGGVIAERMEGKRAGIGVSEAMWPVLEDIYREVLSILEAHFTEFPYFFGGLPSIADHVLMGPLFGHLARDPEPSRLMKLHAPRVFRWTEHMNAPEIQSPEFADFPMAYLPDDEVPPAIVALLKLCLSDFGTDLVRSAEVYNAWTEENLERPAGSLVSPEGFDEAMVGYFEGSLRGVPLRVGAGTYPLWVLQRGLDWFRGQADSDRAAGRELIGRCGGLPVLEIELRRRLTRVGSRMALA